MRVESLSLVPPRLEHHDADRHLWPVPRVHKRQLPVYTYPTSGTKADVVTGIVGPFHNVTGC